MKNKMKGLLLVFVILSNFLFAQQTYYNNVNLTLTGLALKSELSQKIINTHTTLLPYGWTALQQTDLDPTNTNNVLLLYGYDDNDGNLTTDRTRSKNGNGGSVGDWNREHTFAKSMAIPQSLVTNTPSAGTDPHHLRATDQQMNNNRASRKFVTGSGNAGIVGANWYPGDEWKGDVARMMMYMYLRYPSNCLPDNAGVGTSVSIDPDMITLFLDWNAQDAVSQYEKNRNTDLESRQGNRNPFIDNPYLATIIWGGTVAEDEWNMAISVEENIIENSFSVYPVPAKNGDIYVHFKAIKDVKALSLFNVNGQLIQEVKNPKIENNQFVFTGLGKGFYVLKANVSNSVIAKKIVVN
jgi:endonuclease I